MIATFHPQAWVNDYAVPADAEGPTTWDVGSDGDGMRDDTYESDNLRFHPNAPEWVRDWCGPFYISLADGRGAP